MRCLLVSTLVLLAGALSACDSVTPEERQAELEERQEMFEASLPPLQVSAQIVGPSPVRDSLRVHLTSTNAESSLGSEQASLDGEGVSLRGFPDRPELESVTAVSDMDGTFTFTAEVYDSVTRVVDGDTLYANRTATVTLDVEIEQTIWRRGVTRSDPYYADNLTSVFPGVGGELWVHLSAYRSSFWSSPDGVRFERRREGFERYMDSDGETAWIERRTSGGGGSSYLTRVDLATGESGAQYQIFYNDGLQAGAGLGDTFYGIHQSRGSLMRIEGDRVVFVSNGPYHPGSGVGALLDYHISPAGVHWLATTARGVLRNDGTGWQSTSGLGSSVALTVAGTSDGRVLALSGDPGEACVASVWSGSRWDTKTSFERDRNGSCGTVALNERGSVWSATSDGFVTRYTGSVADRRYDFVSGSMMLVQGSTVWVAAGDGLVEIDDY